MAINEGNKNAEKWTLEDAVLFFESSLKICKEKGLDFIGEVAVEMDSYRDIYTYLKGKFKECDKLYKRLEQQCETNCFSHGKKGEINTAMAIVNLKSNHGWTDRVDNTSKGNELKPATVNFTSNED